VFFIIKSDEEDFCVCVSEVQQMKRIQIAITVPDACFA